MSCVNCYIYRCSAKPDMYIYLAEKDQFDKIPDQLYSKLGRIDFAMELELDKDKKLAKEDAAKVIKNLETQGFHLQMPSDTAVDELLEKIAAEQLKRSRN